MLSRVKAPGSGEPRNFRVYLLVLAFVIGALQLIPAPKGFQEPKPESADPKQSIDADADMPPTVRAIFRRSCYDCHSNTTTWPWYSRVAPLSWWIYKHVSDGRDKLDFSQWSHLRDANGHVMQSESRLDDICDDVKDGSMPLKSYLPLHPSARLSKEDVAAICKWTGN
ncbi:MAG TPA: heme-binding domain-containing protein [Bryobacteraceae bacterium]|jgi:hypothetical protein|nr:heme-binding domain-containing protein [Bryobacteraceae bacterium]